MPPPYCYDHPRAAVTVDLAIFSQAGDTLRVLLVRRKHDPYAGFLALPGGFLNIDEEIEDAARRELKEETGVEITSPLTFVNVFGSLGRDPRGRTITVAFAATLDGPSPKAAGADDAEEATWVEIGDAQGLAFDHDLILKAALAVRPGRA